MFLAGSAAFLLDEELVAWDETVMTLMTVVGVIDVENPVVPVCCG